MTIARAPPIRARLAADEGGGAQGAFSSRARQTRAHAPGAARDRAPMGGKARREGGGKPSGPSGAAVDPEIYDGSHDDHTERAAIASDRSDPFFLGAHARSYFYRPHSTTRSVREVA